MNKAVLGIIIAVIVIGGGAWLFMRHGASSTQSEQMPMPTQQQAQQQTQQMQVSPTTGAMQQTKGATAVTIQNYAFSPATLTVNVGDKVTWTNMDSAPHSATADNNSFDTGVLENGQSGSVTFTKAGTYTYHCSVHPMMKATVIVQ